MGAQDLKLPTAGRIPQPSGRVPACPDRLAIGRKLRTSDHSLMPAQDLQFPAGGGIPEARGAVLRCRQDSITVRAEGRAIYRLRMPPKNSVCNDAFWTEFEYSYVLPNPRKCGNSAKNGKKQYSNDSAPQAIGR